MYVRKGCPNVSKRIRYDCRLDFASLIPYFICWFWIKLLENLLNELQTLKEENDELGDDQMEELRQEKEALERREIKIAEILQEAFPDQGGFQTRGIVEILQGNLFISHWLFSCLYIYMNFVCISY